MGALSPRTRNAQVELYQNGDVDYLVSTDAIGMGLNLDITHVAFSGTVKFDGRRTRHLMPHELGQIAGRAGRYRTDGTFGVTGDVAPLEEGVIEAIEEHRFAQISKLIWRNSNLDYHSIDGLLHSLDLPPADELLVKARDADDVLTLKSLSQDGMVRDRVRAAPDVSLLWDTCQIPDFRNVSHSDHSVIVGKIFEFLSDGNGRIPADYLAAQVKSIDKTTGGIDTISKRLAFIRTWTYVSQRDSWTEDSRYWREETRRVEDRLSDALHGALTERFVDRRTSVLMRRLKQRESLVAEVNKDGEVRVDDQFIGRLEGFRFRLDPKASNEEAKTLRSAGIAALKPEFSLRADRMYNAPDSEFDLTEQGGLMWGTDAVGKLVKGGDVLSPVVEVFVDDEAGADVAEKVKRRLSHWMDRRIEALFEPLLAIRPAGLVTVPVLETAPDAYFTQAGYRRAGSRAVRIDMLERLADLIRSENSRGGFEATADMLSLTGLSHEQFSELMVGMGYHSEPGEREKVKGPSQEKPAEVKDDTSTEEKVEEVLATEPAEAEKTAVEGDAAETVEAEGPEMETFYVFTWKPKPRANRPSDAQKPSGKRPQNKGKGPRKGGKPSGPKKFSSATPKKAKEVDPDNPFAALAALKGKS